MVEEKLKEENGDFIGIGKNKRDDEFGADDGKEKRETWQFSRCLGWEYGL